MQTKRINLKYTILLVSSVLLIANVAAQDGDPSFRYGLNNSGPNSGTTMNAVHAVKKVQERADSLYKDEKYEEAFEDYMQLAKYNDKFSQYRVAFMYMNGKGVEKNLAEAYAWSRLAAETAQKAFVNYHVNLSSTMQDEQISAGKYLYKEYLKEYGTYSVATKANELIKKQRRNCTGSRVGSSCNRTAVLGENCGITSQGNYGKNCFILGAVGIPSISGLQPLDMKKAQEQLVEMADNYAPGKVELRELKLID